MVGLLFAGEYAHRWSCDLAGYHVASLQLFTTTTNHGLCMPITCKAADGENAEAGLDIAQNKPALSQYSCTLEGLRVCRLLEAAEITGTVARVLGTVPVQRLPLHYPATTTAYLLFTVCRFVIVSECLPVFVALDFTLLDLRPLVGNKPFFGDSGTKNSSFNCFRMATVSAPRNRSGPARNRSSLPSQVAVSAPPPAAHTSSHLVNRIAYAKIESAPDEAQLPSLLEEAEILAKSFEALQSNGSAAQQKSAQDRAARRYAWYSWYIWRLPSVHDARDSSTTPPVVPVFYTCTVQCVQECPCPSLGASEILNIVCGEKFSYLERWSSDYLLEGSLR